MSIHYLGAWHDETGRAIHVNGEWHSVASIAVHTGGAWHQPQTYAPPLSASAPSEVDNSVYTPNPTFANVSVSATITPSGGQSPYTYQWTKQSGDSRITIGSSTMATTSFNARLKQSQAYATYSWTVTDANGNKATGTTSVSLQADGYQ